MIFNIYGEVNNDMLDKFIQAYNTNAEEYVFYFASRGGGSDSAEAIIDLINKNADKTTIIATHQILSAGFLIFFSVFCKQEILDSCIGMFHQGTSEFLIDDSGKMPYLVDKIASKRNKEILLKRNIDFCNSIGFNESEMKKYKKGDDLYFLSTRLNEFLNKQQ